MVVRSVTGKVCECVVSELVVTAVSCVETDDSCVVPWVVDVVCIVTECWAIVNEGANCSSCEEASGAGECMWVSEDVAVCSV